MGHIRHGSATTGLAVRAAIQRSQAWLAQLSRELGINPKTVAKWRKRAARQHAMSVDSDSDAKRAQTPPCALLKS